MADQTINNVLQMIPQDFSEKDKKKLIETVKKELKRLEREIKLEESAKKK